MAGSALGFLPFGLMILDSWNHSMTTVLYLVAGAISTLTGGTCFYVLARLRRQRG